MTSFEAEQQVKACEAQIVGAHGALVNAAHAVGTSAFQAASNKVLIMTLISLCVAVVGFVVIQASGSAWGVILIIGGLIAAWNCHKSAAEVRRSVQNQQNVLNNSINDNIKI